MKKLATVIALTALTLVALSPLVLAEGGYVAAPPRAPVPGCATCPPTAPALLPAPVVVPQVSYQAQVDYVPQLTYQPQLVNVPTVVNVPRVTYQAQVSYTAVAAAPAPVIYPPVKAPCADFTIQRSFGPSHSCVQRSFVPARSFHRSYGAVSSAAVFAPAPVRAKAFAQANVGYGASAVAVASFATGARVNAPVFKQPVFVGGGGGFASARGGRFVAGSPGVVGAGFSGGFVGGGTNVAARNVAVSAAPGQRVDVRTGGLRGVLFGARVRVR